MLLVNYLTLVIFSFRGVEHWGYHVNTERLSKTKIVVFFNHRRIRRALKGQGTRGVWGHAPPEYFEILVLWNAIPSVLRWKILKAWLRVEGVSSRFYFYFMQFLKLLWNRYHYVPCTSTVLVLICWGLHAVNRTPTSCYFSWKHCWLVFSYHGELSCFQVSKYIKYSTYTGCISLCIYIVW